MNRERNDANLELIDVLKSFIDRTEETIYNQEYIGKVVDNNDPLRIGRCRVMVYGVFDQIPEADLPWALPRFDFNGSEKGSFIVPTNNTLVYVKFVNGDVYNPIYSGKVLKTNRLPTDKNVDYPDMMVFFELDNGDKFTINRSTGKTIYEQRHGLIITMDVDGSFKLEHSKGTIFNVDNLGNINISSGSLTPTSTINIESGAAGSITLQGGTVPCPDLLVDPVTGAPMAVGTLVPGKQIFIP